MKIVGFVTNPAVIKRLFQKWEFLQIDKMLEEGFDWEVFQLIPGTPDGFYEDIDIIYRELDNSSGPDPPISSFSESNVDPKESEEWEYSQLAPGTPDGFYEEIDTFHEEAE